jgi:hypothetical protein
MAFLLCMRDARPSTGRPGANLRLRAKAALAPKIYQAIIRKVPGRADT